MSSSNSSLPRSSAAGQQHNSPTSSDFNDNYSLESYTYKMYLHTKKQMEAASRAARRRVQNEDAGVSDMARLTKEGSVDSTGSARSSVSQ
jgi:hypothetical protein